MNVRGRLPLWIKIVWTAWIAVWAVMYARGYGFQNFLWFCDLGSFVILAALWLESPLLFSMQSASLLVVQVGFVVDITWRLLMGEHLIGGTEHLFDPKLPLHLRLSTLFHLAIPPLLLFAHARLGYDRRGWLAQCLACWVILPVSFALGPALNINWAHRAFERTSFGLPPLAYLAVAMAAYPLVLYLPTHLALKRLFKAPAEKA